MIDGTDQQLDQFSADSIDLIYYTDTPHATDLFVWAEMVAMRLKRGGAVMVFVPTVPGDSADDALNILQKFRDSSHRTAFSAETWQQALYSAQLEVIACEDESLDVWFDEWADSADAQQLLRLKSLIVQAPPEVANIIRPRSNRSRWQFQLPHIRLTAITPS